MLGILLPGTWSVVFDSLDLCPVSGSSSGSGLGLSIWQRGSWGCMDGFIVALEPSRRQTTIIDLPAREREAAGGHEPRTETTWSSTMSPPSSASCTTALTAERSWSLRGGLREGNTLGRGCRIAPDLIVLDLGLPDMDGSEESPAGPARVGLGLIMRSSVRGQEADKIEALDAGADDYLTKPLVPASCWPVSAFACSGGPSQRAPVFTSGDLGGGPGAPSGDWRRARCSCTPTE